MQSKCVKMHVGKTLHPCPTLTVHGKEMLSVSEVTYLGDKVSSDGRNTKNVRDRTQKGVGLMGKVLKLVKNVGLGTFSVEIALLLRNTVFINGMLSNAEVWYNFTKAEVEEFEKVDRSFLQKILGVPKSVPSIGLYLEFGAMPLSVIIKGRRLNYLHKILRSQTNSMLYKVFMVQSGVHILTKNLYLSR